MRKLLLAAVLLAVVAAGCAITDYPVITDNRADFSGVIRTGHKAYIIPAYGQAATIWDDGSDCLFSMVYQNQYGDQKLYTFNNFDPTASVYWLGNVYCDWRYSGCEIVRAWNPTKGIDNIFDYEPFFDCSGARSLSILISYGSRYYGECGDSRFNKQAVALEFSNLPTTQFRGKEAYVLSMNSGNTTLALNGDSMPVFGQINAVVTQRLNTVVPMTPNIRHELRWMQDWVARNGAAATLSVTYGSVSGDFSIHFVPAGLSYDINRF